MFTPGQRLFALIFIIVFTSFTLYNYYKDYRRDKSYFKGVWVLALVIILFFSLYRALLHILK
jgi:hypothetical protein